MCPAICGDSPMSLPSSVDFPSQLKNWLRVQGVASKIYCFGQQVPLCSTRCQPQDCRSLLNLLLPDATGLPAALPSTRQSVHPWVAFETSTLRRVSLVQYSSCCRVSPKLLAPLDFFICTWTLCGRGTCHNERRHIHHCWSRLGHNSFFFFWFWILFAIVEQLVKLKFLVQWIELKWLILNK